ncbi:hypothetical protein [Thiocystis violacea]|uniref:hypothetical protein n=1 Tax=Thiocystis violacea TaxID=13725 RepID=UPI0019086940|nr:hypothetical protein [Thiocystis violacea]
MYINAYRLTISLLSIPGLALIGALGYFLGGPVGHGLILITGLTLLLLIKMIWFQK